MFSVYGRGGVRPLLIHGMHGCGDNLHQRAIIPQLAARGEVWLETSWPSIYWDMPELKLLAKGTTLRTQSKNIERERDRFTKDGPPRHAVPMRIWYTPEDIRGCGSVVQAMAKAAKVEPGDFRIPVRPEWLQRADDFLASLKPSRPVMFFRPLGERTEWTGCFTRNPDYSAWRAIYNSIRERYFVISIADLVPSREWLVGPHLDVDAKYHAGELDIELLIGLAKRSALIFSSPGFAVVLGQAVGTPGVCVFGGYEDARSFAYGAKLTPWIGIEPVKPCPCFSHRHQCDKRIDTSAAIEKLRAFVEAQECASV